MVVFNPIMHTRFMHPNAVPTAKPMEPPEDDATPRVTPLHTAIQRRVDSIESANYATNTRVALGRFQAFLQRERAVDVVEEIDWQDCRAWAQQLTRDVQADEFAASTANQYYRNVRATLTWWRNNGTILENPALRDRATKELPEDTEKPEQQFWGVETRKALLNHTIREVDDVLDRLQDQPIRPEESDDLLLAARDRALAFMVAGTGVRGAEILRQPDDAKRNGVSWDDVSADGVLSVLGKSRQKPENVSLPTKVYHFLDKWRQYLDPPGDDWPVFPTLDKGTLRRDLESRLGELDLATDASVRERLQMYVEHGLTPLAISTNAGRGVMKRLSDDAGLDVDGDYLKPHGGRRTLGHELYGQDPVKTQETLRHKSIETTHKSYRDEQAAQRRRDLDDMVDL